MFKGEPSKDEYAVFTRENILQTKRNMKKLKKLIADYISYARTKQGIGKVTIYYLVKYLIIYIKINTPNACKETEKALKYKCADDVDEFAYMFGYLQDIGKLGVRKKYLVDFIFSFKGVTRQTNNYGLENTGVGDKKHKLLLKEIDNYIAK